MSKKLRSFLMIGLGNLLLTSAYVLFAIPNNIIDGGLTSTSLLLAHFFKTDIIYMLGCLTTLLFAFCYLALGRKFFLKTLFSGICYFLFFVFFRWTGITIEVNIISSILISGILVGIGHYLCLKEQSATISYDCLALFLHQKNQKYSTTFILWMICSFILLLGASFFGLKVVIIGIIFVLIETQVIYWCSGRGKEF